MRFLFPEFEDFDAFGTNAVFVLVTNMFGAVFDVGRRHRFPHRISRHRDLWGSPLLACVLGLFFAVGVGAGPHDFVLFLEAGLVDFFMFEFFLKRYDVVERR
jgi:hypothetical protein